jgi:hypothetical protein
MQLLLLSALLATLSRPAGNCDAEYEISHNQLPRAHRPKGRGRRSESLSSQHSYVRFTVPKALPGCFHKILAQAGDAFIGFYAGLIKERHRGFAGPDRFQMAESIHDELYRGALVCERFTALLRKNYRDCVK